MDQDHVPVTMGSGRSTTIELPALRISDVWFPPGALLPDHTHDRAIFAVTLEGFLDARLAGYELSCETASLWTEPAEERHSNRVGTGGARVLVIMPDPAADEVLRPCAKMLESVNHWRDRGVAGVARRMVTELHAGDAPARLALHGLALEALALAVRGRPRVRPRGGMPAWLLSARDLLHDRFRERLELAEIAHEVGVEPARLAQAFRAGFGLPLGTYQRRLRLDWAAGQLATTDEPLWRIAMRAGFYDQSHFTRHFRGYTGRPPGAWRRLYRHRSGRPAPTGH